MRRPAASLLLFALALALGLAGGLAYAWLVAPAPPAAAPAHLNPTDRDLYLRLVAAAYAADGNRGRALTRLDAAGPDAAAQLAALLASDLRAGRPAVELAQLAADLGLDAPAAALMLAPAPLPPATAAATVAPTAAPTASPVELLSREPLCPGETTRRLEVRVVDGAGEPLPGVAVTARRTDAAGDDPATVAYTGFASRGDAGTADFELAPGARYEAALGDQVIADDLATQVCPDGLEGGWRLELRRRVED